MRITSTFSEGNTEVEEEVRRKVKNPQFGYRSMASVTRGSMEVKEDLVNTFSKEQFLTKETLLETILRNIF
jgi:hypothetical protein